MTPRQHTVALREFTRKMSNNLLKGIPEDKLTFQPSPTDNHALWVMGHLAGSELWIANAVGFSGVTVPEAVLKTFGMNSKPSATGNPPLAEVRKAYNDSFNAMMHWFREAPDSALQIDLKEKTGGFAADPIEAMLKLAWHEGWHMGQVAGVRKALGLPSIFN